MLNWGSHTLQVAAHVADRVIVSMLLEEASVTLRLLLRILALDVKQNLLIFQYLTLQVLDG
jgi:hypothetical protein